MCWVNPPTLKRFNASTSPNLTTTSPLVNQVYLLKCSKHCLLKTLHMYHIPSGFLGRKENYEEWQIALLLAGSSLQER
jgi:hypothetical protein